jgi:hypothetical protein
MKLLIKVFIILIGLFALDGFGQTPNPVIKSKAIANQKKKTGSDWEKTWYAKASITGTFDSNFDHEPVGTKSFGAIPTLDLGYQLQNDKNRFQLQYTIGVPKYSNFARYNRRGQYFRAAYRRDLGKGWNAETEFEALFKGTNEDRELNNQFIVTQKFNYRFMKKNKLGFYGVYRLKRNSDDPNANGKNPQIGVKYTRELTKKIDLNSGFRYDNNIANGERQRYIRRTFSTGLSYAPTTRDTIDFEARYAPRLYGRLIDVNGLDVPRSDKKMTFDVNWRHECKSNFGMENSYTFEKRTSNDVDKKYQNHQVVVSLFYRWGNGNE